MNCRFVASMKDFFADRRPHNGLTYEAYRAHWREQKEVSPTGLDRDERKTLHYLKYNWERQAHVHEAYSPSEALREGVASVDEPQLWMVLTEPWCGDSAFLLPVIAEAASLNEDISLRILLRDENLDVMDQYLTDGSRSIPKLVAFSEAGEERFVWGPRPEGARERYAALREKHDDKMNAIEALIEYYEDGGWRETEEELVDLIQRSTPAGAVE